MWGTQRQIQRQRLRQRKYKVLQRPKIYYIFEEQGVLGDVRMVDMNMADMEDMEIWTWTLWTWIWWTRVAKSDLNSTDAHFAKKN